MFLILFYGTVMIFSVMVFWRKIFRKSKSKEIVIFSRYPIPGTTKTRLIPELGEECASYFQLVMTDHILDNIEKYCQEDGDISTKIYYNGGTNQQMKYWLDRRKIDLSWHHQSSGGLGEKLANALKESFNRGSNYTLVIGSDIPGIKPAVVSEAYNRLETGSDMVLGPAADGGYYLVGVSKHMDSKLDEVFSNINWGTETVFKEQTERAKSLDVSLAVLDTVLNDVDLPEDLAVLEKELGVSKAQLTHPKLSIIIPVYNEADNIVSTLQSVLKNCLNKHLVSEIIISDCGSTDDTVNAVQTFSKTTEVPIKVIHSPPGRGFQFICGTQHASGDHLMFLHADTKVPKHFDQAITKCLRVPGNVAGAFEFGLDVTEIPERAKDRGIVFNLKMKFLKYTTNKRFKNLEFPYGDQVLFMSRKNYNRVGGFKPVYLMEDFMLVEELRKIGHIGVADAGPAITSSRRWEKWGLIKVSGLNSLIVFAYKYGVPPNRLAEWYYGDKLKEIQKRSKKN